MRIRRRRPEPSALGKSNGNSFVQHLQNLPGSSLVPSRSQPLIRSSSFGGSHLRSGRSLRLSSPPGLRHPARPPLSRARQPPSESSCRRPPQGRGAVAPEIAPSICLERRQGPQIVFRICPDCSDFVYIHRESAVSILLHRFRDFVHVYRLHPGCDSLNAAERRR